MSVKRAQLPWHLPLSQKTLIRRGCLCPAHMSGPYQVTWNNLSVGKCYLNLLELSKAFFWEVSEAQRSVCGRLTCLMPSVLTWNEKQNMTLEEATEQTD